MVLETREGLRAILHEAYAHGTVLGMPETTTLEEKQTVGLPEHPEITDMYKAGLHFGYAKTRRHPKMKPFIFGTKSNVEVFDLFKVLPKLHETLDAVRTLGEQEKTILFVSTKAAAKEAIRSTAIALDMPYVTERWLGGTITNFKVITDRIQYWQDLKQQKETGGLKKYTKHEQTKLAQHIEKLDYMFGGLEHMKRLPHAMFVVDIDEESLAAREADRRDIPVIALSNTDTDPTKATHIVPGNDNAKASIAYVLGRIQTAYEEGRSQRVAGDQNDSQ